MYMDKHEKTAYETNPIESPTEAVHAFVEAYDVLQKCLLLHDIPTLPDTLRSTLYQPVRADGDNSPPISIYEIGVVYVPEKSKYGINDRKLDVALNMRQSDVRALFINGILPQLCEILTEFLTNSQSEQEEQEQEQEIKEPPNEEIQVCVQRFLNECRRMTAMWE